MSQRQTVPTTKSGTSENDSPKKEHWKTKQKREREEAKAGHPGKGNAAFTLTKEMEAEAMRDFDALAEEAHLESIGTAPRGTSTLGITQEDMEIEQMLERVAKQQPVTDHGPDAPVVREVAKRDTLRNHVENYKPASSIMELEDQIHLAQTHDIDSIEATPALVRHLWKRDFDYIKAGPGYGIYRNIRVYIEGFFEQNKDADKLTMEQKLHSGGSKVDIAPIIRPSKI